jgi:hypothetical protein
MLNFLKQRENFYHSTIRRYNLPKPWNRFLFAKMAVAHTVKKLPASYGKIQNRFHKSLTMRHNFSQINSGRTLPLYCLRSISILSSYLEAYIFNRCSLIGFSEKTFNTYSVPHAYYMLGRSILRPCVTFPNTRLTPSSTKVVPSDTKVPIKYNRFSQETEEERFRCPQSMDERAQRKKS